MIKFTSPAAILLLAAMMALAPLASAMYLPAFPAMAASMEVDAKLVQLTLSAYMIGLSSAQLLYGPLADRLGRKPLIVAGTALFSLASLGCMLATTIDEVIVLRFLQAFGAAAPFTLGQAVVRDTNAPIDAARVLAVIVSVQALAPAVGPILGGALLVGLGWRSIFTFFALCGGLVFLVVVTSLPESLIRERRQALAPGAIAHNYLAIAVNRTFLGHALAYALMTGGFYAFMAGIPFVLIELLGIPDGQFGWYYVFIVAGFIVGSLCAARLVSRIGSRGLIVTGGTLLSLGSLSMIALEVLGAQGVVAVLGPQVLCTLGIGFMAAQLVAGALSPFPHLAATAAALLGFMQMGTAAATSALVGALHDGTARPMALVVAVAGTGALVSYWAFIRPRPASDAANHSNFHRDNAGKLKR